MLRLLNQAVQFYCRECSCKLTKKSFRWVLEVPSMDWREVSEHFYGKCCCASFGAQAELLVARFQELLTSTEATCLVASTTCIVHKGDVIAKVADPSANISGTDGHLPPQVFQQASELKKWKSYLLTHALLASADARSVQENANKGAGSLMNE